MEKMRVKDMAMKTREKMMKRVFERTNEPGITGRSHAAGCASRKRPRRPPVEEWARGGRPRRRSFRLQALQMLFQEAVGPLCHEILLQTC